MTIDVIDTYSAMNGILTAPLDERPTLLKAMLEPVAGMYRYFPGEPDLVGLHHMGSGFRVDRDDPGALPALEALRGVWSRIATALDDAVALQIAATPGITVPDIRVVIVLGDQHAGSFMEDYFGMSADGGVGGFIWLNFWPSPENLARSRRRRCTSSTTNCATRTPRSSGTPRR